MSSDLLCYNYKIADMQLSIKLNRGCWSLGFDGATGKSYLYSLFRSAMSSSHLKKDFLGITYCPGFNTEDYMKRICNFSGKYILLDRFDLYYDKSLVSKALSSADCVFLDLKDYVKWQQLPYHQATIFFDKNKLEVTAD